MSCTIRLFTTGNVSDGLERHKLFAYSLGPTTKAWKSSLPSGCGEKELA